MLVRILRGLCECAWKDENHGQRQRFPPTTPGTQVGEKGDGGLAPFRTALAAALAFLVPLGAAVTEEASAIALFQNSQNLLLHDAEGARGANIDGCRSWPCREHGPFMSYLSCLSWCPCRWPFCRVGGRWRLSMGGKGTKESSWTGDGYGSILDAVGEISA